MGRQAVSGQPAHNATTFVAEAPDHLTTPRGLENLASAATSGTLADLSGDFTFLHLAAPSTLRAVASVAGVVPIYHWRCGVLAAVGTRLRDLARHAPNEPELDADATLQHLAMWTLADSRSFLSGVRKLRPGHLLTLGDTAEESSYWSSDKFETELPTRRAFARQSDALRHTLVSRIDRLLPADGTVLTVSGGVDSAIVASIAARTLGRQFVRLTFLPWVKWAADRDRPFVRAVDDYVGGQLRRAWSFVLNPASVLSWAAAAQPSLVPLVSTTFCKLPELCKEVPLRTYAGGEWADHLFGSRTMLDTWMTSLTAHSLVSRPGACALALRYARGTASTRSLAAAGRFPLPMPEGVAEILSARAAEKHRDHVRDWQQRLKGSERGAMPLRIERIQVLNAAYWEALTPLGISPAFPFFGREVLELALTIHPLQNASFSGKRLLRHAVRGLVPTEILSRRDKGNYPGPAPRVEWAGAVPPELRESMSPRWLATIPPSPPFGTALLLQGLVNIVGALNNERVHRERLRQAHPG